MPASVTYNYVGAAPTGLTNSVSTAITPSSDPSNPLFNFNQTFFSNLQSISPTDLAQSQPYISLRILGINNQIIADLNVNFFHKPIDMANISTQLRYGDRPTMSLQEITLKTDQASGYLYYTNVTLKIRVHKPDVLVSNTLTALIFPGQPLLLEYGWNSPNEFLNQKEVLSFAVKTYNVSMQTNGELDLTVEGMAYNERFNNTFIGDDNSPVALADDPNQKVDEMKIGGIKATYNQLQAFQAELADIQRRNDQNSNNNDLIKELTADFSYSEKKTRGIINKKFQENFNRLKDIAARIPGKLNRKHVSFHDIFYTLCDGTLNGLGNIFPADSIKVIYGSFNAKFGDNANKSIASFPINFEEFKKKIADAREKGSSITIERLLNILIDDFINNPKNTKGGQETEFVDAYVAVNFSNRRVRQGSSETRVIELAIIDVNKDLPVTTLSLPQGRTSPAQTITSVVGNSGLPVLYLGHANSFIKNITLNQFSDEYMKAVLIERMSQNRISNVRDTLLNRATLSQDSTPPFTLPLKGTASVVGHVQWKPFRAFYLSTGIFFVDAVYKILSVTHRLSAEGFSTDIEFLYH